MINKRLDEHEQRPFRHCNHHKVQKDLSSPCFAVFLFLTSIFLSSKEVFRLLIKKTNKLFLHFSSEPSSCSVSHFFVLLERKSEINCRTYRRHLAALDFFMVMPCMGRNLHAYLKKPLQHLYYYRRLHTVNTFNVFRPFSHSLDALFVENCCGVQGWHGR